ncbi:Gfo/Idh/MocA family oxidoreductase [Streptomyces caelestis]|uniref:CcbZ n=1 Tax=Streptomyces caelestis TaxID=36816 RepID=E9JES6_9ACTN|nr:Gfo/Idh/MocA family oxidoreductase [Streptomyces caelestis]ADB92564.1 CcbZ [Streptomyces caelestis]MBB5794805.1 putative dehydrogenase/acyl carrier protein [Streptomyces caelestis]GGW28084.1 hypothetical protein GCM10010320_03630 [Streptomyces caelestis]
MTSPTRHDAPPRVGIIGTGLQARRRIAVAGANVVAVAGHDAAAGEAFAAEHGIRAEKDWHALVGAADIDIVLVCTPPHLHAEMSIAALEAHKHVLCEKPFARTGAEAERMLQAARTHGKALACGFNHRHHPALAELRRLVTQGRMGRVLWARFAYGIGGRDGYENEWRADPAQVAGGQLMEQGIHAVDLLRTLLGDVESTTAVRNTAVWPAMAPLEDDAMVLLRHHGGAMSTIHSTLTQWVNLFRLELGGERATAEVQGLAGSYGTQTLTVWDRTDGPFSAARTEFRGGDRSWQQEWEYFLRLVDNPGDLSSAEDGAAAVRIVEAAYQGADGLSWARPATGADGSAAPAPSLLVDVLELLRPLLPSADTELTPDTELFSSQLLDSLALEEIQAAIESRWVPLPPEELTLANFNTPAAIAETIARTST